MTPEQLDIIAGSAADATTDSRAFARSFYDRLFEIDPALRTLFSPDLEDQYDRLVGELGFLAGAARDLDGFSRRALDLGRRHAGYGVTTEMFPSVQQALLHALETNLGDRWDVDHRDAWSLLFNLIAQIMLDGASDSSFAPI